MPEGPLGGPRPAAKSNLLLFLGYGKRRDDGPMVGREKDKAIINLVKGLSEDDPEFENIEVESVEFNAFSVPDEGFIIRQIIVEIQPNIELDNLNDYLSTLNAFLEDEIHEQFKRVTIETT